MTRDYCDRCGEEIVSGMRRVEAGFKEGEMSVRLADLCGTCYGKLKDFLEAK